MHFSFFLPFLFFSSLSFFYQPFARTGETGSTGFAIEAGYSFSDPQLHGDSRHDQGAFVASWKCLIFRTQWSSRDYQDHSARPAFLPSNAANSCSPADYSAGDPAFKIGNAFQSRFPEFLPRFPIFPRRLARLPAFPVPRLPVSNDVRYFFTWSTSDRRQSCVFLYFCD